MFGPRHLTFMAAILAVASSANYYDDDYEPQPVTTRAPKKIRFKPPFKALDPDHHKVVFKHFRDCTSKCVKTENYDPYTSSAWDAFSNLGSYTACVSTCIAHETLQLITYYKSTYAKLLDITESQIRLTKGYIAGTQDLDFFGNRTRVGYSCCLPDEFFVKWSKIAIPVNVYFRSFQGGDSAPTLVNIRADKYLEYCYNVRDGDNDADDNPALDAYNNIIGYGGLKIQCSPDVLKYLQALKNSVGHNILHPDYQATVPDGACTDKSICNVALKPNPKATRFPKYVCVAEKTLNSGLINLYDKRDDDYSYLQDLLVDETNAAGDCEDLVLSAGNTLTIKFKKVLSSQLELYTITGLPSFTAGDCKLQGAITTNAPLSPSNDDINCITNIDWYNIANPTSTELLTAYYKIGGFEYCNARQYLNHLTFHASYHGTCEGYEDVIDFYPSAWQYQLNWLQVPTFPDETYSIACLYRIFSLKCDCMQAVLDCYSLHADYKTALGKTLGRASSILCGFFLCQRASVYRLFLNAEGVAHTTILAEVLLQASGQMSAALPMASMALVSFGLGMIAFVAAKRLAPRKKSTMEDGYANLI